MEPTFIKYWLEHAQEKKIQGHSVYIITPKNIHHISLGR